jgi:glycosyltransferase involved in cell wall biosynthesis
VHVAIEAIKLLHERRGIGRYMRNLLPQMAMRDPQLRFTLYVRREGDIAPLRAQLATWHAALPDRTTMALVRELPRTTADAVWYPWNFITVAAPHRPMVVTMHDVAPMLRLDHRWWKLLKRVRFTRRYRHTMQRAAAVLTVSEFSKGEIVRHLGADASRITVTPLAADDLAVQGPDATRPLDDAGIAGPFFMTVGGQEGRKNLGTLYRAMDALYANGMRIPLVQCGPGMSAHTRARAGSAPWLHHVGFVSDAELVTLYRRAVALVLPSRYEGFGLPVLEAMRAGCPVICADSSALPEVAGGAALLFPWDDAAALAAQMTRLANDPVLRAARIAAGVAHAARFSWSRAADQTLACFAQSR